MDLILKNFQKLLGMLSLEISISISGNQCIEVTVDNNYKLSFIPDERVNAVDGRSWISMTLKCNVSKKTKGIPKVQIISSI